METEIKIQSNNWKAAIELNWFFAQQHCAYTTCQRSYPFAHARIVVIKAITAKVTTTKQLYLAKQSALRKVIFKHNNPMKWNTAQGG